MPGQGTGRPMQCEPDKWVRALLGAMLREAALPSKASCELLSGLRYFRLLFAAYQQGSSTGFEYEGPEQAGWRRTQNTDKQTHLPMLTT